MFAAAAKLFGGEEEDFFGSREDLSAHDSNQFDNDFEEATKRFQGWSTGESYGDNVTGADLGQGFTNSNDQGCGLPAPGRIDGRGGSEYADSPGTKPSSEYSARSKQKPERCQGFRRDQKYQKYPTLGGSGEENRPVDDIKKFVLKPELSTENLAPPHKKYVLLDKPNKRKLFNASSRPLEI